MRDYLGGSFRGWGETIQVEVLGAAETIWVEVLGGGVRLFCWKF